MRSYALLVALVLLPPALGLAQATAPAAPPSPPDRATILKDAREIMAAARFCAFITLGPDGRAQARAIDFFAPEDEMTVWLATKAATRKVAEVKRNPKATVYCYDPKGPGYVTILGDAAVVTDPAEKARRWKDDWAAFYDDRNRGADYVLIRVKPVRLELVSYGHGVLGDPKTWRPVEVLF
jgi:general stress protein 26